MLNFIMISNKTIGIQPILSLRLAVCPQITKIKTVFAQYLFHVLSFIFHRDILTITAKSHIHGEQSVTPSPYLQTQLPPNHHPVRSTIPQRPNNPDTGSAGAGGREEYISRLKSQNQSINRGRGCLYFYLINEQEETLQGHHPRRLSRRQNLPPQRLRGPKIPPILQGNGGCGLHGEVGDRGREGDQPGDLGHGRTGEVPQPGRRLLPRRRLLRARLRHHQQTLLRQHRDLDHRVPQPGRPQGAREVPLHPHRQQDRPRGRARGRGLRRPGVPLQAPQDQTPHHLRQEPRGRRGRLREDRPRLRREQTGGDIHPRGGALQQTQEQEAREEEGLLLIHKHYIRTPPITTTATFPQLASHTMAQGYIRGSLLHWPSRLH